MESDASNPAQREAVPFWGDSFEVDLTFGRIFAHELLRWEIWIRAGTFLYSLTSDLFSAGCFHQDKLERGRDVFAPGGAF